MFNSLPNNWSQWTAPAAGRALKLWKNKTVRKTSDEYKSVRDRIMATCSHTIVIDSVSVIV